MWEIGSLAAKLMWYLAVISVTGGGFSLWLIAENSRRFLTFILAYIFTGALTGFHGVVIYFLCQVGAINDRGVAGMFDWSIITFLLGTSIGKASVLRMATFLILMIGAAWILNRQKHRLKPPTRQFFIGFYRFIGFCVLALLLSFSLTGHLVTVPVAGRAVLMVHVLAISMWIGALFPLLWVLGELSAESAREILKRFGQFATYLVVLLAVSALIMVWYLLSSPRDLYESAYGLVLTGKFALVCGLLGLAALNRWRLVPLMDQGADESAIRKSIIAELALAMLILLVTLYLSTIVGPQTMES